MKNAAILFGILTIAIPCAAIDDSVAHGAPDETSGTIAYDSSASITIGFEDLGSEEAFLPTDYADLAWDSGWMHYAYLQFPLDPESSGPVRICNGSWIDFGEDIIFLGSWIGTFAWGGNKYWLGYNDGELVYESSHITDDIEQSGWINVVWPNVDYVEFVGQVGSYAVDDISYVPNLSVSPSGGLESSGDVGGPFTQTAKRQLDGLIEWELSKDNETLQKDKVLVALYLDDDGRIKDPSKKAVYRCYSTRGGYSGIRKVPYGAPWLIWERLRSGDCTRRIVIDPGPPYEIITKNVNLIPGQVTNLGCIKLQKVMAIGTVSISGVVKTEDGVLLEGAKLSSEKYFAVTDSDGRYSIDGLGLEVCDLKVTKPGYVPASKKITIRDMENRNIKQNFILSIPRRVTIRYMITPGSINDFTAPQATGGTLTALVNERYLPLPVSRIKNDDLKQFVNKTRLKFRLSDGKLTLHHFYSPIFYEHIPASSPQFEGVPASTVEFEDVPEQQQTSPKEPTSPLDEFKTIKSVGFLAYNAQHCPPLRQGDILLIDGGKISDYKIKLLFEKITRVLP